MSLRHCAGAEGRRVFPVEPADTIVSAKRTGFRLIRQIEADSVQAGNRANGVYWTWLVLILD